MSKVYKVGKVKQLIDLNQDSTNFDASFRISSKNKAPFDILVVDQTTLDTNPNLEYKRADGEISGRIVHDKNTKQNFFIILKADQDCECMVEIDKKDLPKSPPPPPVQTPPPTAPKIVDEGTNWPKVLLIVLVVVGIGFALYWFSKKRDGEDNGDVNAKLYTPPEKSASPAHPSASPSPVTLAMGKNKGNPLLDRLKSLKLN
jgi:hypothetical protein